MRNAAIAKLAAMCAVALGLALPISACGTATSGTSAGASSGASSTTDSGGKSLSLATVTIAGGLSGQNFLPFFVAQQEGYFKAAGLTVQLHDTGGATASDIIAGLVGGSYQFTESAPFAYSQAVTNGASLMAIAAMVNGDSDILTINKAYAAQHKIPSANSTPAEVKAQILALKGSHLSVAASSASSIGYIALKTLLLDNGLKVGSDGDVNITTNGSQSVLSAGFNSGKFLAIVNSPRSALQPNSVIVPLGKVAPVSNTSGNLVVTSKSMLQQHPDTVQAFITAMVKAWEFVGKNPSEVLSIATPYYKTNGVTTADNIQYNVNVNIQGQGSTPAITDAGYAAIQDMTAKGMGQPLTQSFASLFNNSYVNNAIKQLGLSIPTGP